MKYKHYSEEEQQHILDMHKQGLSSRKIAKKLDRSKSGINDFLSRNKTSKELTEDGIKMPKILFIDYETMPSKTWTFGRFKQNICQDAVEQEGGWLVSYSYKWLGDEEVKGRSLTTTEAISQDDSLMCMEVWDLIEQADYVCAHNYFGFDSGVIKVRCLLNGLPPMRKVRGIDTLKMAQEFRFNSKKLDSLCCQIGLRKLEHSGIDMWVKCSKGNQQALDQMQAYNRVDIELLEKIYLFMRPHSTRHPNLNVHHGDKQRCNVCLSDQIEDTGNDVTTNLSVFPEYKCKSCGWRGRGRKAKTTKEQRANFLSN